MIWKIIVISSHDGDHYEEYKNPKAKIRDLDLDKIKGFSLKVCQQCIVI